jgi:hypothetical protein
MNKIMRFNLFFRTIRQIRKSQPSKPSIPACPRHYFLIRKELLMLDRPQLSFIASIREKIRLAQYESLKTVNTQLINLYWDIGRDISAKQSESWGKSITTVLSKELQKEFPGISGFRVKFVVYGAILFRISRH